jgi:(R,R)-butanediol dehydrogenase/meso-butanediol dehydrogenase/diacetyl reductase
MKAAVLSDHRPDLEVVELPEPRPGEDEVLVRVTACGVCGSDVQVARTMGASGTVLGHEIAGVVEELGARVDGVAPGTVVAVRPFFGCGMCGFCRAGRQDHCATFEFVGAQRPGGFAERTVVRASEVFPLPAAVRGEDHALVEPFAVARRALRRGALEAGEAVVVLGAGPMGLAVTHWARALGAGRVVVSDPAPGRRELARQLGADVAVSPEEITGAVGDGAPLVVECSGKTGVLDQALRLAAVDGRVTVVGICLASEAIHPWSGLQKELDVRFSLYSGREDFTDTIDGFASGTLSPDGLVTDTVGLDALPARFALLASQPDAGKVVVTPSAQP